MRGPLEPKILRCGIGDDLTTAKLYYGQDVRKTLQELPEGSVQAVITSPPYFGLRDYGAEGQIGLEDSPDNYAAALVEVFREAARVLRHDGTLWLNLGDSYNAAGREGHGVSIGELQRTNRASASGADTCRPSVRNLKPKDLIGIPWKVAFALQADGWYLRSAIPWVKRNPMPTSQQDRPTTGIEYVFLFAHPESGGHYFYDIDATRVAPTSKPQRRLQTRKEGGKGATLPPGGTNQPPNYQVMLEPGVACTPGTGRNRRDTDWFFDSLGAILDGDNGILHSPEADPLALVVAAQPYVGAHFATWPVSLVRPMVQAGSQKGSTILDPFSGSATTGTVANQLGRDYIGIDINASYLPLAEARLLGAAPPAAQQEASAGDVFDMFAENA
jgi:DNA modification methylase